MKNQSAGHTLVMCEGSITKAPKSSYFISYDYKLVGFQGFGLQFELM
jgi:hypothetical protein